ncbi:MAG: cupin domain-containing protein [Actinomycetota bacterium]|nr:cupin domain-containing protein [Actinomycetota bacterium]
MKRLVNFRVGGVALVLLGLASLFAAAVASPATGVAPTVLARGTYDAFKVKSVPKGPIEFEAEAKPAIDLIVRRHDYLVGSTTGWHSHPGPVFITVTQGELTYYEYDDPNCTPHVVEAGHGFVDDGSGHIVRNESGRPAQDVSVITAPVAGVFRSELAAPGPHCGF